MFHSSKLDRFLCNINNTLEAFCFRRCVIKFDYSALFCGDGDSTLGLHYKCAQSVSADLKYGISRLYAVLSCLCIKTSTNEFWCMKYPHSLKYSSKHYKSSVPNSVKNTPHCWLTVPSEIEDLKKHRFTIALFNIFDFYHKITSFFYHYIRFYQ